MDEGMLAGIYVLFTFLLSSPPDDEKKSQKKDR
jgi:hypothetical protein